MKKILAYLVLACTMLSFSGANGQEGDMGKIIKVKFETMAGDIYLDLYADKAPNTVANFMRYVDAELYNASTFFRGVRIDNQDGPVKIEGIQGGLGAIKGLGPIKIERTRDTGLKHLDGTITMARDEPDTAAAEWFICVNDQPSLDFAGARNPDGQGFAAFGRVTKGMDVVRHIQNLRTHDVDGMRQTFVHPVRFLSVTRVE